MLSEQQLVDCSWDFGENSACDGGMYDSAMDYVITKAGGAVTDASYEYLGADGFCKATTSSDGAVPFKVSCRSADVSCPNIADKQPWKF